MTTEQRETDWLNRVQQHALDTAMDLHLNPADLPTLLRSAADAMDATLDDAFPRRDRPAD